MRSGFSLHSNKVAPLASNPCFTTGVIVAIGWGIAQEIDLSQLQPDPGSGAFYSAEDIDALEQAAFDSGYELAVQDFQTALEAEGYYDPPDIFMIEFGSSFDGALFYWGEARLTVPLTDLALFGSLDFTPRLYIDSRETFDLELGITAVGFPLEPRFSLDLNPPNPEADYAVSVSGFVGF